MPNLEFIPPKTIAQAEMRSINRSAVLEYLRLARVASRTEIAKQLKISKPTAKRIVDQLLAEGLVRAAGLKAGKKGRSRQLLALETQNNLVIAVDIGGSHISGVIANIGGEINHEMRTTLNWAGPEENFDILVKLIRSLLAHPRPPDTRLLGIAVGVPGIVGSQNGLVRLAPSLSWNDFPLLQKLELCFDTPIIVENDVNLAVLGEYWFGAGIGVPNLVMVAIGTGIGAGIILDGKLHRGYQESSGEVGYLLPGIEFLNQQYPGFGALESVASGIGIAERGIGMLKERSPHTAPPDIDAAYIFQAAREGHNWAARVVAETVDYLSLAVANITVCLDPELVILGGGVSASADLLVEPIKKRLAGVIPNTPRISPSTLEENAVLLGGVVRVFQKVTGYSVVHSG